MKFSHLSEALIQNAQFFLLPFTLFSINPFSCICIIVISNRYRKTMCFLVETDNMKKDSATNAMGISKGRTVLM